jgi:alcohol-forming fatty acyl-CoA reductase
MTRAASIGAFFDLDGTLLPPPSLEARFLKYLLARRLVRPFSVWKWMARAAQPSQFERLAANKKYLEGLAETLAAQWAEYAFEQDSSSGVPRFFKAGLARIAWHQSQNHRVFLISGTLAPLASQLLPLLPGEIGLVATKLVTCLTSSPLRNFELAPRAWTGELAGEHMVGYAKSRAMVALAARHRLDLSASYAYGDSLSDRSMLEMVGTPEAVNPSLRLAHVARRNAWAISRWTLTGAPRNSAQAKLIPITRVAGAAVVEKHS